MIPCTTNLTPPNILRVHLPADCSGNDKDCDVMVDQSRAIDNRRLEKFLGTVPTLLFDEVVEKLRRVGAL